MNTGLHVYTGEQWEHLVHNFLSLKYGPRDYILIPDRDRGDLGLEGFSTDGCVYQCYVAEEPLTVDQLYAKQRNKITADIRKFIDNERKLVAILGDLKICRWILVVPRHDSRRVLVHAANKSAEVLGKGLRHVDDGFRVQVVDGSYFELERRMLASAALMTIGVEAMPVSDEQELSWTASNAGLIDVLRDKVSQLPDLPPSRRVEFCNTLVGYYLVGQNVLQTFNDEYPEIGQLIERCKNAREFALRGRAIVQPVTNRAGVADEYEAYRTQLANAVSNMAEESLVALAWEAIADWLMRCPLRIEGGE